MSHADALTYRLDDVTEALARLSMVAAQRQLVLADVGVGGGSPEELLTWWQAVAAAAGPNGDGDIGAAASAYDALQRVFNYVEGVIISCGAPDSFDIYEVCFESLAKIGFCLQSAAAKELLVRLLETVHEVYDVLLSCVETYEWVQPGATGLLRLWMLQVIFACFGSTKITGRHLMALTDNDVSGAVSLISFILRCEQAPFQMQSTAGRCLVELTTADSVFMTCDGEGTMEDMQNQQISMLTAMLNRHVNGLIKGIIQFDVVEAFGRCICQHQMSHGRTDVVVQHFLTMIHNCLLYCSENQKNLRQHLATQSTIVQDIMIPYVTNILPALYDNPHCGPSLLEWRNLKSVMQTFVVVTFNINVFRPHLRDGDLMLRICEVPNILSHLSMLELMVKICINVDFTKGPYFDQMSLLLQGAFSALSPENQCRLQRRMTSEHSMRLPYTRSSGKAMEALAFALCMSETEADPATADHRKMCRKHKWRNAKNKSKKRKRLFAMQQASKAKAADGTTLPGGLDEDDGDEEEDDDSDDDDMPPLIPAESWEPTLGVADEIGVPSMAKCQLSGALMHDPVATPEGNVFERAALEDWVAESGTNPLTGAPLVLADCQTATELQSYIQGYQMQMLSAAMIAPATFDASTTPAETQAAPTPAMPAPAPVVTCQRLLGDLPALGSAEVDKPKKKEKGKIRIESRSVIDCPEDMRCAIDGKVCVNPVRSPYGHLFEKKTLDRWFLNCGSVCPVTSKPLRPDECVPDLEMKKRVVKYLRGQQ